MNNVNYSGVSVKDLNDIQTFLNNKSVAYAKHIVEGLKNAIANLKKFPEMGWQIFTEQHKDLRQILFHTYRIVYHYQPNTITVVTIQYQTRPPENIPQLKDFKI